MVTRGGGRHRTRWEVKGIHTDDNVGTTGVNPGCARQRGSPGHTLSPPRPSLCAGNSSSERGLWKGSQNLLDCPA